MVAAVEVMLLAAADPVDVAVAAETVIAWAHARQLEAMDQVACEQPAFLDPTGRLVDPAPAEIATSLHWSTGAAAARVDLAQQLCTELPGVLAALRTGRVDLPKAQEIAYGTCELDPGVRVRLAGQAVGYAEGHTRAQLRAWLTRRVAAIDPDAVQRRRRKRSGPGGCGSPRTPTAWPPWAPTCPRRRRRPAGMRWPPAPRTSKAVSTRPAPTCWWPG